MRRTVRRLTAVVATGLVLAAAPVRAQDPAAPLVSQPGVRIVAGQSAIIGGNGAGARERALEEAFRQAVDQSLAEMLDTATRASQARAIKALDARARTYVRRYRALEEGETNGAYAVRLEVELDEPALRRATERWGQPQPASPGAPPPVVPGLLLVSNGAPEATALLLAALVASGARAQAAEPAMIEVAAAQRAATRASLPQVAFVSAQTNLEGPVRGTTKIAVSCRLGARIVSAPSGLALGEPVATPRAFADQEAAARTECLTRAAAEVAARLAPTGGDSAPAGGDLRTVTVAADVVEPAAVVALLKDVRSIGSVSSAELRRIEPGHAEIRARTRALATALAPALTRDAAGTLTLSNVEVAGDVIRLRARLRPPPTP
jgi:hypothetical protein